MPYILRLELKAWEIKLNDRKKASTIEEAIEILESRHPELSENTEDCPIFIFSAGWRSGSTLLQRLIMSNHQVMIWGEPFAQLNIIERQMRSLASIRKGYPEKGWLLDERISELDSEKTGMIQKNIANLYPEIGYLKKAHRRFFLELFSSSAIYNDYHRWGIKEVRLGIDAAFYFKWLFPNSKFLFLYRDPYKGYSSLKPHLHKWSLYKMWPQDPIRTPYKFGKHWEKLVRSYLENSNRVNGLLIKYEELQNGQYPIERLEEYLDLQIDRDVLNKKVGSTKDKKPLTRMEVLLLNRAVNPLAMKLGYTY